MDEGRPGSTNFSSALVRTLDGSTEARLVRLARLRRRYPERAGEIDRVVADVTASQKYAAAVRAGVLVANKFLLGHRLGAGGMGEVWFARDIHWNHRPHALKFLNAGEGVSAQRDRLLREAASMVDLRHEKIVMLRSVSEHQGIPFLAMDYVPGPNLDRLLQQRRQRGLGGLGGDAVRRVLHDVAEALGHAHARGVAHRDIKPANLLVDAQLEGFDLPAGVHVKLADFGIAVSRDQGDVRELAGTPGYMAPELLAGEPQGKADLVAADLYALGVTLYHLLAGDMPFPGRTPVAVLEQMRRGPPPPPPGADPALRALIERALRADPAERPRSVQELLHSEVAPRTPPPHVRDHDTIAGSGFLQPVPAPTPDARPRASANGKVPAALPASELTAGDVPGCRLLATACAPMHANHVLELVVDNPACTALEVRVFVDVDDERALSFASTDRLELLPPLGHARYVFTYRAHREGRFPVAFRLHARAPGGHVPVLAWQSQPDAAMIVVRPAGVDVQVTSAPCDATTPDGVPSARDVRLAPARPAWGVARAEVPSRARHVILDVLDGSDLARRVHVLLRTHVRLGRTASAGKRENHLALLRLPCRSPLLDADNWRRNSQLSRTAGVLALEPTGTLLRIVGQGLATGGAPIEAGRQVRISSRRATELRAGGLDLRLTALPWRPGDLDVHRLLVRNPLESTLSSGPLPAPSRHRAVRIERLGNFAFVEYVVTTTWISLGGGPHDTVRVEGLPPTCLTLASGFDGVYLLCTGEITTAAGGVPGLWQPLDAECRLQVGPLAIRARPGMAADTEQENDTALVPR